MKLRRIKDRIAPAGSFNANMLIRMSGTAMAQLIILAVSPVLTRLFAPEAFGALGVYTSLVFIVASVVTLQYDQALILPKDNGDAAVLLWASLLSVGLTSGISLLACLVFFRRIASVLRIKEISGWIFLIPASIFLQGVQATLTSWSVRRKKFARASISQVARAASMSGVQFVSGILQTGPGGLVGGSVAGDSLAALSAGWLIGREDWRFFRNSLAWKKIRHVAGQYRDFPLFSGSYIFLNAVSKNIPVFLLANFFGPAIAGYYAVGVRVIQAPMNFVLTSLRQVLFQRASEEFNRGGDTYILFRRTTAGLLAIAAIPALLIMFFGPQLFVFALGAKWRIAGEYARWMVLWFIFGFANVPAIIFGQIYRRQKTVLLQNVVLLFFRILAMVVGGVRHNPLLAVVLYSVVGMAYNLTVILWAGNFLRKAKGIRDAIAPCP